MTWRRCVVQVGRGRAPAFRLVRPPPSEVQCSLTDRERLSTRVVFRPVLNQPLLLQSGIQERTIEPAVDIDIAAKQSELPGLLGLEAVTLNDRCVDDRRIPVVQLLSGE